MFTSGSAPVFRRLDKRISWVYTSTMKLFARAFLLLFAVAAVCRAEDPPPMGPPRPKNPEPFKPRATPPMPKVMSDARRKQQRKGNDNEKKEIEKIVADYKKRLLSKDDAREKLRPLVEIVVKPEFEKIDGEIAKTKRQLDLTSRQENRNEASVAKIQAQMDFLNRASSDPSVFVDRRINELLGIKSEE